MGVNWRRFGPIRERMVRYPLITLPLFAGLLAFGCSLVYAATSQGQGFFWLLFVLYTRPQAGEVLSLALLTLARSLAWGVATSGVVLAGCLVYRRLGGWPATPRARRW
jgi:hypothetical protein